MNKSQLIEALASELGGSKAAAGRVVDAFIMTITRGIEKDKAVTITGFGTFAKKDRPPRVGRNPTTGEPLEIKASRTVSFKASAALKDRVARRG